MWRDFCYSRLGVSSSLNLSLRCLRITDLVVKDLYRIKKLPSIVQFTSICLRGSKISRHWPCREDVSVTVDQGRNNAPPGTRREFPYGIAGVAWRREWDSRRYFVECWGNDLGLVWLRMKGRGAGIMRSPGSTNCQIAVLVISFKNYVYVVHPGTERRHPGDSPTPQDHKDWHRSCHRDWSPLRELLLLIGLSR